MTHKKNLDTKENFLPVCRTDMERRGWHALDIILITGDAYVDHHSYGAAVIGRFLESKGYRVGIIARPDWKTPADFMKLGKPRLFFGITSGNLDSMIANYTANKKTRSDDESAPGGLSGGRPDRAVIVYANRVREAFKDVPIVLGGMEASLRRLSHYDYWDNKVRRSILLDSRADILVYGMGEKQALEIAVRLEKKQGASLDGIKGTVIVRGDTDGLNDFVLIPSFSDTARDKDKFAEAFRKTYENADPFKGKIIVQPHDGRVVAQYPPAEPMTALELDAVYELPYANTWHPSYDASGGVKGFETVRFSITAHRGCFGECSFCSLYFHQGRVVTSRSALSIEREARLMAERPDFKGTITDIGGPTANQYAAWCSAWEKKGACRNKKCLIPEKCPSLKPGYGKAVELLRKLRNIPGVKHVFIGSGFRHDMLTGEYASRYLDEICAHHISGLIKVAPEHCSNNVLKLMNKPSFDVYENFVKIFQEKNRASGRKNYIVNYFISAHPGSGMEEALKLALYLAKRKVRPQQIQDFLPSPMTLSTCMYHTGKDPFTGKKVYIPSDPEERRLQRALLQYWKSENRPLIIRALKTLHAEHVLRKLLPPPGRFRK
ncbi:MAG: YgiQ family radical SAM protein [Candidatus Omnitrophota bacterium]